MEGVGEPGFVRRLAYQHPLVKHQFRGTGHF